MCFKFSMKRVPYGPIPVFVKLSLLNGTHIQTLRQKVLEGNPRKEADESSYLIALPDGETEGPYTKNK